MTTFIQAIKVSTYLSNKRIMVSMQMQESQIICKSKALRAIQLIVKVSKIKLQRRGDKILP
jgi:hypothetical protein